MLLINLRGGAPYHVVRSKHQKGPGHGVRTECGRLSQQFGSVVDVVDPKKVKLCVRCRKSVNL